jgi:amino acid transporter
LGRLVAALFFIVSGGPYGIEELVSSSGYGRAMFLLVLTPLLWALPTSLMVGELSSALPEEGGYYAWVRRALGPFWGFQEAWLSLVASVFDMALYPTLFVLYLGQWIPRAATGWPAIVIGALVVVVAVGWNLAGARAMGSAAWASGLLVLLPFAVLAALGLTHPGTALASTAPSHSGLLTGLLVVMWNFMGWDNGSTFVNEVERPSRTYPRALAIALSLVTLVYLLPVAAAWRAGVIPLGWSTGAWVQAGRMLGGAPLAAALVAGGMLSPLASFGSLVLSYSRLPAALARDGYLPRVFGRHSVRSGAPWVSVLACGALYVVSLGLGFERLIELDVVIYGLSLLLEFVALVVLRIREPNLPRPFRIPGGLAGVVLCAALPTALLSATIGLEWVQAHEHVRLLEFVGATLVLGLVLYASSTGWSKVQHGFNAGKELLYRK